MRSGRATSLEPAWRVLASLCLGAPVPRVRVAPVARIVELAREHRLAARAGGVIAASGAPLPDALARPLRERHRAVLGDHLLFEETLGRIDRLAEGTGTPVLVLKGADLARRIYRPGERPHNDLDLLVPREAAQPFWERLCGSGFSAEGPPPSRRRDWFATTLRSKARRRVQIDLHWDLGTPGRTHWDLPALVARAEPLPGHRAVRRLEAADLAVHLALHAVSFHGASGRRLWWLDLHLLGPLLQREETTRRAEAAGGRIALGAARLRAWQLFGEGNRAPSVPPRSRFVAALGKAFERARGARAARWLVAATAIDRPRSLLRVLGAVAWRPLAGGRAR